MTRQEESVSLIAQRLSHELDDIAGLADALPSSAINDGDRCKCAIGVLANEVSRRLDALYAEAMMLWRTRQALSESV